VADDRQSVSSQFLKETVRLRAMSRVMVITATVPAPPWRVHEPVVMVGAPVCQQMIARLYLAGVTQAQLGTNGRLAALFLGAVSFTNSDRIIWCG
jgi:hypothetical protein